jgi:hypothetical protein
MTTPSDPLLNLADVQVRHGGDDGLFADIGAPLAAPDACHRFGVSLLYRRLARRRQELLVEEVFPRIRRVVLRPVTNAAGAPPVSWRFDPDGGPAIGTGLAMPPAPEPIEWPEDNGSWA